MNQFSYKCLYFLYTLNLLQSRYICIREYLLVFIQNWLKQIFGVLLLLYLGLYCVIDAINLQITAKMSWGIGRSCIKMGPFSSCVVSWGPITTSHWTENKHQCVTEHPSIYPDPTTIPFGNQLASNLLLSQVFSKHAAL